MNTTEDRFTAEQIMEVERRTRNAAHNHEYSGTTQQAKRCRETASILRQAASDTARIAELTAEVDGWKRVVDGMREASILIDLSHTAEVDRLNALLRLTNDAWEAEAKFHDVFDAYKYGYGDYGIEDVDAARANNDACYAALDIARNALKEGV